MSLHDAFDDLRYNIKNLNCYRSAYVNPVVGAKIQDKFGTVEILSNTATSSGNGAYRSQDCVLIHPKAKNAYIDCFPNYAMYINLRNDNYSNIVRMTSKILNEVVINGKYYLGFTNNSDTLILPPTFFGHISVIASVSAFKRGIYLNSYGSNVAGTESWIYTTNHIDGVQGVNLYEVVVDFDSGYNMSPMYLNRLYLSTQTFANLANKLGTVTGGKLYLGTKNTDRMTTAQKDAITAKGWTIY